ncbi:putative panthothenate kinase [Talaromyces proteolyticus]|uniref:Panthothenate kinase n=1 Tax=Talaromyces proteolyticus TaxID=1131652 RepID=A0AAD4PXH6_9EURO|nr:putative panthothenate kinase [Talaromyces proteolyticus]KAH8693151.1 putative panthothenate kinase [Talaromyces proteolyticus]
MMEEQVDRLVKKTWAKFLSTPTTARLMIAISGIPGSGKTSLAGIMARRINELYAQKFPGSPPVAIFVPMDGYHLTRAQLAAMPDPAFAAARRGAAFTFDPEKFLRLVKRLREDLGPATQTIFAPSFDHAVKDPVEDDIPILATSRVIFFEGNYLSLDKEPWNTAASLMDELWFVEVDFETARHRLIKRHVEAGIAKDAEEADKRARENDLVNGSEIVNHRMPIQEVIISKDDATWER